MEWLPIETAPKDGTLCEVRFRDRFGWIELKGEHFLHDDGCWYRVDPPTKLVIQPTHWHASPPLPKEPGVWGASIVAHPVHIAEQRRQNQEARDTADGAMDPKEPA